MPRWRVIALGLWTIAASPTVKPKRYSGKRKHFNNTLSGYLTESWLTGWFLSHFSGRSMASLELGSSPPRQSLQELNWHLIISFRDTGIVCLQLLTPHTCILCCLCVCEIIEAHIDMLIKIWLFNLLTDGLVIVISPLFYLILQQRSTEMLLWSSQLQRLPGWREQS